MIRFVYGDQLKAYPFLADTMFKDRASQFKTRLNWEVSVDSSGQEQDEYDALNPLYVIWQLRNGGHGGSIRFLPTTGPTMVNDHFSDLAGAQIVSPLIWEVTRFCLSQHGRGEISVAAALLPAAALLGARFHLNHAVGVFDANMVRIYRKMGWSPDVLGTRGAGKQAISVGLWDFQKAPTKDLAARAGLDQSDWNSWFKHLE